MKKQQMPASLASYYANSISGSVIEDYRAGRVVTVYAGMPRKPAATPTDHRLAAALARFVTRERT